ncbi:MAG: YndJ family transporter [Saprospiraceae bacterium]|nr:YndJ family transporter [Saprospiraceae bacterium]
MKTKLILTTSVMLIGGVFDLDALLNYWEFILILFAAWVLAPNALSLLGAGVPRGYNWAVAFLALACFLKVAVETALPVWVFALGALPYLILTTWVWLLIFIKFGQIISKSLGDWVRLFAVGYWVTAAFWVFAYLADWRPFEFDMTIVALTSAHFHLAGFILTVAIWKQLTFRPGFLHQIFGVFSIVGMPLVAIGIVVTKLGGPGLLEMLGAAGFALFAVFVAVDQSNFALQQDVPVGARRFLIAGAVSLVLGMALAGGYALRFVMPIEVLNIPNMKWLHGTLNTFGFALLTLHGWKQFPPE